MKVYFRCGWQSRDRDGRCAMKKRLSCRAMGMNCDFVTRDESEQKIVQTIADHLKQSHKIELTEDLRTRANNLIRLEEA
jgi:predicted small metal-binding protein